MKRGMILAVILLIIGIINVSSVSAVYDTYKITLKPLFSPLSYRSCVYDPITKSEICPTLVSQRPISECGIPSELNTPFTFWVFCPKTTDPTAIVTCFPGCFFIANTAWPGCNYAMNVVAYSQNKKIIKLEFSRLHTSSDSNCKGTVTFTQAGDKINVVAPLSIWRDTLGQCKPIGPYSTETGALGQLVTACKSSSDCIETYKQVTGIEEPSYMTDYCKDKDSIRKVQFVWTQKQLPDAPAPTDCSGYTAGPCTATQTIPETSQNILQRLFSNPGGGGIGDWPSTKYLINGVNDIAASASAAIDAVKGALGLAPKPGCNNGVQDAGETGIDCGGACLPKKCDIYQGCQNKDDCKTNLCIDKHCKSNNTKTAVFPKVFSNGRMSGGYTVEIAFQGTTPFGEFTEPAPGVPLGGVGFTISAGADAKFSPSTINNVYGYSGNLKAKVTSGDGLTASVINVTNSKGENVTLIDLKADKNATGNKTVTVALTGTDNNGNPVDVGTATLTANVLPAPALSGWEIAGIAVGVLVALGVIGYLIKLYMAEKSASAAV